MLRGFGSGHAGLRQLKALPVDILSLEGALIQNLPRSTDDRLLVRSLVDLAQHLGIATLAEWVQDEASARLLAEWGIDYIEGPLAGGAVPASELVPPGRALAAA
jgi:EAL domain-containing protein (putative c-di-GMP-specific phosphodiesterase class I)